jgi:uncharacterized protein
MILDELQKKGLIKPPSFIPTNTHYLTITGSIAYGAADTNSDKASDLDIYGFCIPPKEVVFPHLAGEILGFDNPQNRFDQWIQHHVIDPSAKAGKGQEYDFTVYNIVRFFRLLADNNPNILDSVYTPTTCVLHSTQVGNMIRENRRLFLHKGLWAKFRGYSYSQLHKMKLKPEGKRLELYEKFGYDIKFAMHLVRLLLECEQLLTEGDMDFSKNAEVLKSIRRGEWPEQKVRDWFDSKEKQLEGVYLASKLPEKADEEKIKELLLNCLESHYGNLKGVIVTPDRHKNALMQIRSILDQAGC